MRSLRLMLGVVPLAASIGCGGDSPASPESRPTPLTVSFSATMVQAGHYLTVSGVQYYGCTFAFTAKASGNNNIDYAGLYDGEINFRLNSSGALSTFSLYSTDLQDWFGTDNIRPGTSLVATRDLVWSGPFTANVLLRYTVSNFAALTTDSRTATIPVTCS